jgi:hypothetical protein
VDIALNKKADNARELGLDYEPVLKDNSNYRYDPPFAEPVATLFGSLPVYDTTPPAQPAPVPLTDWVSVDDRLPESGGYYLVTVDTDEGPHVDVIMYNAKRKHWEHEGEPTFCHSYLFSPTHWAARPEAAQSITKGQS